jgi:hypothetical protein
MTVSEQDNGPSVINLISGSSVDLQIIADKHFPHDCRERRDLLRVGEWFMLLWQYHCSLERTHKILTQMRSTGAIPAAGSSHEFDVLFMTANLNKLAKTLRDKDGKEIVATAGMFMERWLLLESTLNDLMEQSRKLRVGLAGERAFS